jgi:hypothetical protein
MERFNPPGLSDDFARRPGQSEALARGWDAIVESWMQDNEGLEGGGFYNPRSDQTPGEPSTQSVPWDAFPRFLEKWFEEDAQPDLMRWKTAETLRPRLFGGQPLRRVRDGSLAEPVPSLHRQQDEYCEWFAHRDGDGHIVRLTFTCEGPEYWQFLAGGTRAFFDADDPRSEIVDGDIGLVAELYAQHVDPSVQPDDLVWPFDVAFFSAAQNSWSLFATQGTYNPFNRWNTTDGAMHLTHPANTLGAEVNLAARSAVLRADLGGKPITDQEALVCCSGFGDTNRSSDPSIGAGVNGLVRQGLSVSLADPVGLYIAGANLNAFEGPNGEDVSAAWQVARGVADRQMILRATFAVPKSLGFTVDEVLASGEPIAFGGQVVDAIQMTLTGIAKDRGQGAVALQGCITKCCEHPQRSGIETVVDSTGDCSAFPWEVLEPFTEPAVPEPTPTTLVAESEDVEIEVAPGLAYSRLEIAR